MRVLRRISGVLVVFLLCQGLLSVVHAADTARVGTPPPNVSAQAAAMIDVASGRILYEKNGDQKMRIASLTKTMTAIVAIESGNLKDIVTVPDFAVGAEGSSIYLKQGERLTLEDLLYGLMLRSGNDAALAIANHVGGSVEGFVYMMNEKAAMIGMTHTHFTNPHGLDDSDMHYSTANDMVKLSAYALKNPVFRRIVSTKVKNIPWEGENWDRRLQNKNKMLFLYKGADGVKTGYTKLAKRCLASSATRDGRQLAVITLDAPDDWNDSAKLLDWGFSQFQPTKLVAKGQTFDPEVNENRVNDQLVLSTMNEFDYPLAAGEEKEVSTKVTLAERRLGKSMIGSHVGFVHVYLGDKLIGKVPLTVREAAALTSGTLTDQRSFWRLLWRIMAGGMLDA